MIYIIGMSHAINVLKVAHQGLTLSHDNWTTATAAGQFFDVPITANAAEAAHSDHIKAFVISHACGWGSVAELRTLPGGQRQVAAVEGFIQLLASIEPQQDSGVLFSFINGNEHSSQALLQHPRPFDFMAPDLPDQQLLPGFQPIPASVVREQMEKALNGTLGALSMMRVRLPRMRIVHVMSPPPVASEEQIRQHPEVFKGKLDVWGITPISIRVKYHRMSLDILRRNLTPLGIEFLEVPEQTMQANGAIRNEYAFGATHGNTAYGELIFRQILAMAEKSH